MVGMSRWLWHLLGLAPMLFQFKDSPTPPAAPAAPDPSVQTSAQAKALPSVYSPFGSMVYSGDPTAGTFRQDVSLSPEEQAKYSGRNRIATALLNKADAGLSPINVGGFAFTPSGSYQGAAADKMHRLAGSDFNFMEPGRDAAALDKLSTFADASKPVSGDAVQQAFFDKQKALLDPVYARDEGRLEQKLSNQGLPIGSEAHAQAMDEFNRGKALAYEQASQGAVKAGADETSRQRQQSLAEIAAALGGSQAQTGAEFGRTLGTRQQRVADTQADFSTGAALDARSREAQLQERQQRLNEVAQALGGSQLQPLGTGGGSPLDVNGAFANQQAGVNRQYQGQLAGYNAGVATQNSAMGGLFGLGAAALPAILASDRRLKRDVVDLGEIMPGIHLYEYAYLWGPQRHRGVMADEVERVMPEAVLYDAHGFQMVDYGRLFGGRTLN